MKSILESGDGTRTFLEIEGANYKINFESIRLAAEKFNIFPSIANWIMNMFKNILTICGLSRNHHSGISEISEGWCPVTHYGVLV